MADEFDAEALAGALKALSHPVRLEVLRNLRVPKRVAELRLSSGQEWSGLQPGRPLTRPAIFHHVEQLEQLGFVERLDEEEGRFVVNQQKMFAFIEQLGALARIRPVIELDVAQTIAGASASAESLPPLPRLLVVSGPKEGHAIALSGNGPWQIGRAKDAHLRLEYDPHVSREHVEIRRNDGAFFCQPNAASKNPAFVNYRELRSTPTRLAPGDILAVGSSRVAFQA